MAKRSSYEIAGLTFDSQVALVHYIRKLIASYGNEEILRPKDLKFILRLLQQHPSMTQKIGVGVRTILVRQNPVYNNTRGFWIVRHDGSQTDFSWKECLHETPHDKRFLRALRVAIDPDIQAYRREFFAAHHGKPYHCPYTGELVTLKESHVDHKFPLTFQALAEQFIAAEGLDIMKTQVNGKATDNVFQDTLDDQALAQRWIAYHRVNACLQVISRTANLSILRRTAKEPRHGESSASPRH